MHPTDPNIVYVAAVGHLFGSNPERGLYKSIDGGKTWKLAKFIDNDTGFIDVAMDSVNPKILYAASFQRRRTWWGTNGGGAGSALWKTMDAGETWTKITGGGFPAPKDGILGRIGISVFRAKPTTLYIIAEVGAEGGISVNVGDDGLAPKPGVPCCGDPGSRNGADRSGVWRSDDAGKTWQPIANFPNLKEQGWRHEMVCLANGWLLASEILGPGVGGERIRYVLSRHDGATWGEFFEYYNPGRAIGGRACPRTVELGGGNLGVVFYDVEPKQPGGPSVFFLKLAVEAIGRAVQPWTAK